MPINGRIQVYTGNGKGKTTAAFGLALRAAGRGYRTYIAQFVKGMHYAELDSIEKFLSEFITIKQYGRGCFINGKPAQEDVDCARAGLNEMKKILASGEYDVIILDEANIAVYFELFSAEELLDLLAARKPSTEVVITGRYAHEKIIEAADLVTEMTEIKHYYNTEKLQAREGIEF